MIENFIEKKPVVVLVRHAERAPLEKVDKHKELPLTEKGIGQAVEFGKEIGLNFEKVQIFHTPVKRCQQTGDAIKNGIEGIKGKHETALTVSDTLDETKFFDAAKIGSIAESVSTYGYEGHYIRWLNDEISADIIPPYSVIARAQMRLFSSQIESKYDLVINVAHDWNICAILRYYFRFSAIQTGIPGFLSKIFYFINDDGDIELVYHNTNTNEYNSVIIDNPE